jgi:hypothetical protein
MHYEGINPKTLNVTISGNYSANERNSYSRGIQLVQSNIEYCFWSSPVQSFLIWSLVDTHDHTIFKVFECQKKDRDRFSAVQDFSPFHSGHSGPCGPPNLLSNEPRCQFLRDKAGRCVKLTTHHQPRLRMIELYIDSPISSWLSVN